MDKTKVLKLAVAISGAVSLYVIYKAGKIYFMRRKYRHIPGPPTKGILGFFFGNIFDVQKAFEKGRIYPQWVADNHEKYGEVFKYQFFEDIIVFTSDREIIRDALITKDFPKSGKLMERIRTPFKQRFLGFGLVTEIDYVRWKHRRALFNPGFQKNILMTFVGQFNTKADMLLERLRTMADGKTIVNLFTEFNHVTLDAIAQIAFGMNLDSINYKDTELYTAIDSLLRNIENTFRDPFAQYRKRKMVADIRKFAAYVRKVGHEIITERLRAFKNQDHLPNDILSNILSGWKDEDMDIEQMIDDFATFFIAGQETTANTLAFAFFELGRHPEILKKAREEVDRVLGERSEISYQDAIDLKYCNCIFREALRLYPPAALLSREAPYDIEIQGYKIPSKSTIQLSTFVCGRYEKYFKNALEFRPERFLKNPETNENEVKNYTYFPFSLGPRNCIGQNFAQIEGVIMIAKLIQKFDYILDPANPLVILQELTLRPKNGTRAILTLRQ